MVVVDRLAGWYELMGWGLELKLAGQIVGN